MIATKLLKKTRSKIYRRFFKDRLGEKHRLLAGVAVRDVPLLEDPSHEPNYKDGFLSAISDSIDEGDSVELVGFGRGVSTIHVLDAGAKKVIAYEAADRMIELGVETLDMNRPFGRDISVKNALIGDPIKVYGSAESAKIISPEELCESDVLVLDCEGSEKSIIEGLGTLPKTIICETHPERGVPTEDVMDVLKPDYEINQRRYHPDQPPEKKVITAQLSLG